SHPRGRSVQLVAGQRAGRDPEPGLAPGLSVAHPRHAPLRARGQAASPAALLPARTADRRLRLAAERLSLSPPETPPVHAAFFLDFIYSETAFRLADAIQAGHCSADIAHKCGEKLAPRIILQLCPSADTRNSGDLNVELVWKPERESQAGTG